MHLRNTSRRFAARLCVAGAVAATVAFGAPALSAAAAHPRVPHSSPPVYSFGSDGSSVTVHGNSSWVLSVNYGATGVFSIGLELPVTSPNSGNEIHAWNFPPSKSNPHPLFVNSKHDATLKLTNPMATVNLVFTETSSSKGSCAPGGSATLYKGTLKGSVKFNTELPLAGTVNATTWTAKGATPTLTANSSCIPNFNPCLAVTTFASTSSGAGVLAAGFSGSEFGVTADDVTVASKTKVSQVAGATRDDAALLNGAAITLNSKTNPTSVSIGTSSSGIITGTATMTGGKPSSTPFTCKNGGKTYHNVIANASNATYQSPAGHSLVGKMTLTPNMTAPAKSTSASWNAQTIT